MKTAQVRDALAPFINRHNAKTFVTLKNPDEFISNLLAEAGVSQGERRYLCNMLTEEARNSLGT